MTNDPLRKKDIVEVYGRCYCGAPREPRRHHETIEQKGKPTVRVTYWDAICTNGHIFRMT